ncbi:MAG: molybdenum cofactor biosynthesis protein C [Acetothermia bacterium 64_32]|nr:MAG: molybdenum cofactor biosynthesis protein C [Acetothermia bacterium 64_32]MBC7099729.1 cyclic pyranopterin monophosphate synthase MoaC [Candidatus Bipolaricaulota bacterium]HAF70489.1 cyclic pyranopterin monophosphate synthase MoaC [Candidatus Acetothermia bacterium]
MELSHLDEKGRVRMVDVSEKPETARTAVARGRVVMSQQTCRGIAAGELFKGNVLITAQLAGIMAAKRTGELIPLCHPLPLAHVDVRLSPLPEEGAIEIEAEAKCVGKTGVEMEALTAVAVAALTVYDMVKSAEPAARIEGIRLVRKSGGKSGEVVLGEG